MSVEKALNRYSRQRELAIARTRLTSATHKTGMTTRSVRKIVRRGLCAGLAVVVLLPVTANATVLGVKPAGDGLVRTSLATFATATTWLYGDSITVQSWQNLHLRYGLAVDAKWGRSSGPTVDKFLTDLARVKRAPRVVVMAVGTNDHATSAALRSAVSKARRASVQRGFKLIWVNVYVDKRDPALTAASNAIISASGVTVADWSTLNTSRRDSVTGLSPWLDATGIHVNLLGAQWRCNLIQRAIGTQSAPR